MRRVSVTQYRRHVLIFLVHPTDDEDLRRSQTDSTVNRNVFTASVGRAYCQTVFLRGKFSNYYQLHPLKCSRICCNTHANVLGSDFSGGLSCNRADRLRNDRQTLPSHMGNCAAPATITPFVAAYPVSPICIKLDIRALAIAYKSQKHDTYFIISQRLIYLIFHFINFFFFLFSILI